MTNPEELPPGSAEKSTPPTATGDVENQRPEAGVEISSAIVSRWRREDLLRRAASALRGFALLFSLLSFIVLASNKHGDWKNFDKYEEYRYLLAIAICSSLYSGIQVLRHVQELSTGKFLLAQRKSAFLDFIGDQVAAYLMMSSVSAAIPLTNRMREGDDNLFTDASAAAISMSFLAFLALAVSALLSGLKLSTQTYI